MHNNTPSQLSDHDLTAEVGRLVRCEREATAALVAHLAEFEVRRLYLGAGCRSLFAYCTEVLHLSEYGAFNRIEASRAARRFPVILGMLNDGSLNLATVRILAPHLTDDNHRGLLAAATHCSKREVEHLVALRFPRPAVATMIRKLPARTACSPAPPSGLSQSEGLRRDVEGAAGGAASRPATGVEPALASLSAALQSTMAAALPPALPPSSAPPPAAPMPMSAPAPRPAVTPLAADRYQIRFTASAETHQKLRQAQELLGHSIPSGDVAAVVDRALTALLAELSLKKLAATDRPRAARRTSTGSRHISAQVRRTVWRRDGGQCAFVATSGLRCSARKPLEFHHVHPYGDGGEATVGNIELRCRSHNAYEAEVFYGRRANSPRGELSFARSTGR
jgi:hypothetical protein